LGKIKEISEIFIVDFDLKIITMFGEEDFLLDEDFKSIVKKIILSEIDEFNFEIVDCEKIELPSFMSKLNSIPMMGDKRFIVALNFESFFKSNSKSKKNNDLFNELKYYLNNPANSTLLIIKGVEVLNGFSISKKTTGLKFPFDILIEKYHWIEYNKIESLNLIPWVKEKFKSLNKNVSIEAIELILASTPESLRGINNEIDKILSYSKDFVKIDSDVVEKVVGISKENNVFELQKLIGEGNLEKSLLVAENILKYNKQEIFIVSILFRYFLTLWKLIEERVNTQNNFELAKKIGVYYKYIPDYQNSLKIYSKGKINRNFSYLCEADEKLKSSSGSGLLIIQELIIKMVG
jgi:DNA polymerase-3 subunit delta